MHALRFFDALTQGHRCPDSQKRCNFAFAIGFITAVQFKNSRRRQQMLVVAIDLLKPAVSGANQMQGVCRTQIRRAS